MIIDIVVFSDLFSAQLSQTQDCELILNKETLDREVNDKYEIEMRLDTLSAFTNPKRVKTMVSGLQKTFIINRRPLPMLFPNIFMI